MGHLTHISADIPALQARLRNIQEKSRANGRIAPPSSEPPDCPTCKGCGWVRKSWFNPNTHQVEATPLTGGFEEQCVRCTTCGGQQKLRLANERWKSSSNIPFRLVNITFDTYRDLPGVTSQQISHANEMEAWSSSIAGAWSDRKIYGYMPDQTWMLLTGGTGYGKTGLALCCMRLIMQLTGCTGKYCNVAELLAKAKAAMNSTSENASAIINSYKEPDVLVLDDLGTELLRDWGITEIYGILNHRAENQMITLITSNLAAHALQSYLTSAQRDRQIGFAIWSRVNGLSRKLEFAQMRDLRQPGGAR